MKKFTEKDFKSLILNETKKVSDEKGLSLILKESTESVNECPCDQKSEEKENFLQSDNFEEVQPEEFMEEAVEVKQLSEEVKRMKQLLSFNNPLLKL